MSRLKWADLEAVYAVTAFEADGTGRLTINTQQVRDTLLLIDQDSDAMDDAGMAILTERNELYQRALIRTHAPSPAFRLR